MRPLSITIEGDFAFVYYAPAWQMENTEGKVENFEQRRLEILRRVDGRWKFYGGMGAPSGGG
jgi:ketosteroid isomerase-like protein